MVLLLTLLGTTLAQAAAGDSTPCPLLFFTNTSSYNVVVGQRIEATTYYDRVKIAATDPIVWQVAQAGACIPLGRLNKDQFKIQLVYQFYGVYYGSAKDYPVEFDITQKEKNEPRKYLYNVALCQSGWPLSHTYTTKLCDAISPAGRLQDVFTRGYRCMPYGMSGKFESMEELHKIGSAFVDAAKDPAYAYLFLHLPKIDINNKASTAVVLAVAKHLWWEALDSGLWVVAPNKKNRIETPDRNKDLELQMGKSLSYYDWLGMHAYTILSQAYTTVEAQCK
jgi:hypothetical protein